ncbi:hypothetical protein [Corynebacterium sp.]|uniref:hypothetical protein n=1 Tax=Corynebacterium sp. TaxID=1720 RepID=UPI003B3A0991
MNHIPRYHTRARTLAATVAAIAVTCSAAVLATPSAVADDDSPRQPAGLILRGNSLIDPEGDRPYTRGIAPGNTFYVQYSVSNPTDQAVTITGYDSKVTATITNEKWLDRGYAPDYCQQFFVEREPQDRQQFPVTLEPGENSGPMYDNSTYEFLWEADNPCQGITFGLGTMTVAPDVPPPSLPGSGGSSLTGSLGSLSSS